MENRYQRRMRWFKQNPAEAALCVSLNTWATDLVFFSYPALLVVLFLSNRHVLARAVLVPLIGLCVVKVLRKKWNKKRPYEIYHTEPLIEKDTRGESFPSNHVFSSFMIAMCWLLLTSLPGVAFVLFVLGVLLGVLRVLGGVHFVRDVVAGAGLGILFGLLFLI